MERLLVDTNPERQGQTQPAARVRSTWSLLGTVALLGAVALLPRVLGLADFATTDEVYHWIARTERFADAVAGQRWAETNQTGHPGVTLMWLGSLGLALERFAVGQGWASVHSSVEHLAWLRLPAALLQAGDSADRRAALGHCPLPDRPRAPAAPRCAADLVCDL
jgi:hypothetical protein